MTDGKSLSGNDQPPGGGPPYEIEEVWEDGSPYDPAKPHPFAEIRFSDDDESPPPYPPGLVDRATPELLDGARHLLGWILRTFWTPKALLHMGSLLQLQKFDLLDWLRPLELLLRRLLLVEALSLLSSQSLPQRSKSGPANPVKPDAATAKPKGREPSPHIDPKRPETWKLSFRVIPPAPQSRRQQWRRPLPPVQPDREFYQPILAKRHRRVWHPVAPLVRRLEAAIRVAVNPAPFARRLAFRLRARSNPNAGLLLADRRKPKREFARDALRAATDRLGQLYIPLWEVFRSSA